MVMFHDTVVTQDHLHGLVRELEEAGMIQDGHFAYRSGMHSLRLLDRDRLLSDTHLASRLGYALAKQFFLTRIDVVAAPSIWGAGLAQWIGYFLRPRRPVIYARQENGEYFFTPGDTFIEGQRILVVDNLILTGTTMQQFIHALTARGGIPAGVATLANLSGLEYPIRVVGLLNEELEIFSPQEEPDKVAGSDAIEVGY